MILPRYPIYVPTKGRYGNAEALTIRFLTRDRVPFWAVVEQEEVEAYLPLVPEDRMLVLPESGRGLLYVRNWIMDHSIEHGDARHWQLDDNIRRVERMYLGRRIPANAGPALACVEDLSDRYENVALAGLNYAMFGFLGMPPFVRNVHVYSCTLVDNSISQRWRLRYNDDTDLCLQVLAGGLCTILVNVFLARKAPTMTIGGGNTADLYQGDGRLVMARSLERMWPGVVSVDRRYGRPQHVVRANWTKFDTPLKLREGVDLAALKPNEYGYRLDTLREIDPDGSLAKVRARYGLVDG